MSRDWTPKETYMVEQRNLRMGLPSLWWVMETATWSIDGAEHKLHSDEEIAVCKQYPMLGLLYSRFSDLHKLCKEKGELEFLAILDSDLEQYVVTGKGDRQSPLILWYEGRLDPNFYYRERNNDLFYEWVKQEIK